MGTQSPARKEAHEGVNGARTHGGEALNDTMGTDDGNGAKDGGALSADGEKMEQGDTVGPGGWDKCLRRNQGTRGLRWSQSD